MKLKLKNIGKIVSAEIEISGISIIAGLNSTGKSTISRSLFAMFNSLHNLSGKVKLARKDAIQKILMSSNNFIDIFLFNDDVKISYQDLSTLLTELNDSENIIRVMEQYNVPINFYEPIIKEIVRYNSVPQENIEEEIILEIFEKEFNNRICNIYADSSSEVGLIIKENELKIKFDKESSKINVGNIIQLQHEVVYIDDPFIIDSHNLSNRDYNSMFNTNEKEPITHRELLISQYKKGSPLLIDKAELRERMNLIYKNINETLGEDINIISSNQEDQNNKIPEDQLPVDSLSSGTKTFYLIKCLLDNGTIVQHGTLILDEPEVHLHPSWQLKLAEIIVLLQKELQLHILINTHSPYFLRAIDVYSKKYNIEETTNFYLSYNDKNESSIKKVTALSEIYKILSYPLQMLENEGM